MVMWWSKRQAYAYAPICPAMLRPVTAQGTQQHAQLNQHHVYKPTIRSRALLYLVKGVYLPRAWCFHISALFCCRALAKTLTPSDGWASRWLGLVELNDTLEYYYSQNSS